MQDQPFVANRTFLL